MGATCRYEPTDFQEQKRENTWTESDFLFLAGVRSTHRSAQLPPVITRNPVWPEQVRLTCAETGTEHVKTNICPEQQRWFVVYSPSSDSLSESWLMMSFLCSSACSRAAWSFRGNSEASSSIYKQSKTLQSPAINSNVWRARFKGSDLPNKPHVLQPCLKKDDRTVFFLQMKSWTKLSRKQSGHSLLIGSTSNLWWLMFASFKTNES